MNAELRALQKFFFAEIAQVAHEYPLPPQVGSRLQLDWLYKGIREASRSAAYLGIALSAHNSLNSKVQAPFFDRLVLIAK